MALKACRKCGKNISTEARTCPHCGVTDPTKDPPALKSCRECGASISAEAQTCPQCGVPDPTKDPPNAIKDKTNRGMMMAGGAGVIFILVVLAIVVGKSVLSAPPAAPPVPPIPPKEENLVEKHANMSESELINSLPTNHKSALAALELGNRQSAAISIKDARWGRAAARPKILAIINAIIKKDQHSAPYLYSQGNGYLAKKQYDLAIQKFDEAISLGDRKSYDGRGIAWLEKHEYERAIADFTQAEASEHGNYVLYIHRAEANEQKGDRGSAIADYRRALALAPDKTINDQINAALQRLLPSRPEVVSPPPSRRAPTPQAKRN
jgi:RNA polymerase subunit RPABC4/transcription elongation factor Spt4/Flp pilus assembly protein TadD